jgi:hypothetical protein
MGVKLALSNKWRDTDWMLRRIVGPKREEVAGGWRRLHCEELHNVYISSNIIRGIKSRRMRWTGQVACMG